MELKCRLVMAFKSRFKCDLEHLRTQTHPHLYSKNKKITKVIRILCKNNFSNKKYFSKNKFPLALYQYATFKIFGI